MLGGKHIEEPHGDGCQGVFAWLGSKLRLRGSERGVVEQIDQTVEECVDDAKSEGLTRKDLDAAAGGNLRGYLLDFITTMNE